MKKRNKIITMIVSIAICICMVVTSTILLVNWKKGKTVTPDHNVTIASTTGAAEADKSQKGGYLYLAPGASYTMMGGSLSGGDNTYGGAVYVSSGATFKMTGGTITDCFALYGGAIYIEAGGTCEITGGRIEGNYAQNAPAIYAEENAILNISQDSEEVVITNNEYKRYALQINVYEGETLLASYTDNDRILDVTTANANGVSYEDCVGYYVDSSLNESIEIGTKIEIATTTAATFKTISATSSNTIDLYTRQVTEEHKAKLAYTDLTDTTCSVRAGSTSISGEVLIPAMQNGKYVTSITAGTSSTSTTTGFDDCAQITSVVLPSTITTLNNYSFSKCTSITGITIPNGVTSIGTYAFQNCTGLTSIEIPNSVTSIGGGAFYYCTGLTSIEIPDSVTSIGSSAFYNCSGLTEVHVADLESFLKIPASTLSNSIFYQASNAKLYIDGELITNVVVPEGVTSLGATFAYYNELESITLPSTLTSIGNHAFYSCTGLTSIEIPNSVTSIGYGAFQNCTGLAIIYIPSSVTTITASSYSRSPFYSCSSSLQIYCGASSKPSGWGTYWNYYSSSSSSKLSVTWGVGSDFTIENGFAISNGTLHKYIGTESEVVIPDSVTSIGTYAFQNCTGLTSIEIPNSVTSIGYYAFDCCTGITEVHVADLESFLKIPVNDRFDSIFYQASNAKLYVDGELVTSVVVPEGVTTLWANLAGLEQIETITLPSTLTSIGDFAFYNISVLTSIEIPNSVTSIGYMTFYNCTGLTIVEIPDSVTSIGDGAFDKCSGLKYVYVPDSLTYIGLTVFSGCSNATIYCGLSQDMAVDGAGESLGSGAKSILYNKTLEEYREAVNSQGASFTSVNYGHRLEDRNKFIINYDILTKLLII